MRHLKRFKNWIAVAYYACWSYSQQFQNRNNQNQPGQVAHDDFNAELEAEVAAQIAAKQLVDESEVQAQQQVEALGLLDAIAKGTPAEVETIAPAVEVKDTSKVIASEPVADSQPTPAAIKADVKRSRANGNSTQSETPGGKYQPGAINDQTAQRLARLLVSEIKLYQKSKTEGADESELTNIYDLLKDPIDKSRQHYKQRMGAAAMESMPDYFHSELVRTLCGGDASRLGSNYPIDRR